MTDWYLMVERIQNAMQAPDKAHETQETLRKQANHETFTNFQTEAKRLQAQLQLMKQILGHGNTYSLDELAEALGRTLNKEQASYRRIPRFEVKR